MTLSWFSTVFIFALVGAISPGPVNMLAMTAGVNSPLVKGLRFAWGATTGFCLLLLLGGLGLQSFIKIFPEILIILRYGGAVFLLWLAWLLWQADGQLDKTNDFRPTFLKGFLLQWLNPKAWLVSLSVVSLYAPNDLLMLVIMTAVYYVVCFASCSTWLLAGQLMSRWLKNPIYLRWFNRSLALLLVLCLFYLFF